MFRFQFFLFYIIFHQMTGTDEFSSSDIKAKLSNLLNSVSAVLCIALMIYLC